MARKRVTPVEAVRAEERVYTDEELRDLDVFGAPVDDPAREQDEADAERDAIIEELGGKDPETTAERDAILADLAEEAVEEFEVGVAAGMLDAANGATRFCGCGCGQALPTGKNGKPSKARFVVGHDMKHKSSLLVRFDAGDEAAGKELVARGWRTQADLNARSLRGDEKQAALAANATELYERYEQVLADARAKVAAAAEASALAADEDNEPTSEEMRNVARLWGEVAKAWAAAERANDRQTVAQMVVEIDREEPEA